MTPRVRTVAVGRPRDVPGPRPGESTSTAIGKQPVDEPVDVGPEGLAGDEQADRVHHGGPEKSVRAAVIGERWRIGTAELEVVAPRIPCFKLGLRAGDPTMPRRFVAATRPGASLRVTTTGTISAGDTLEITHRPEHGVGVADVVAIYHHDRDRAARLLDAPGLPSWYHDWARRRLVSRD